MKRFCHSTDQQNQAVKDELNEKKYKGWVLVDNLFKGGNTKTRYGRQYFDKEFTGPMLLVEMEIDHPVRKMISAYLKENNFVVGTTLTTADIETVMNGGVI